jgi:tetratricopeptide repeat protein 30
MLLHSAALWGMVALFQVLHSCIVNLVIGTLYCAKQNYEFGISRVMKALEPLETKLEADTWFYAKRCFLALVDGLAKHMIFMHDESFGDVIEFLDKVTAAGRDTAVSISSMDKSNKCVSDEAQMLKETLLASRYSCAEICVA